MIVKKKFMYDDIELRIVEVDVPYLNSGSTVKVTKVIAPNGGTIPLSIKWKQTLKSIAEETINTLNDFKSMGAHVRKELLN